MPSSLRRGVPPCVHAAGWAPQGEHVTEKTVPRDDGEATADKPRRSGVAAWVRETVIVVGLSLLIATLVRIFLVQAFLIPSQSMEGTLHVGDRVLVSKLATRFGDVQRGDIVVFADPDQWLSPVSDPEDTTLGGRLRDVLQFVGVLPDDSEGHLIKRVIGIGGDTVACCDEKGRLTVNGLPLDESDFLSTGDKPSATEFEATVPAGQLFVMGDHRSNSGDSRVNGTVPEGRVTGRAFAVVWPLAHWGSLSRPEAFTAVPEP
ncbi:MAG: signal peptidase I [Jiangellaceae bacterium]|nr:signal peptidase I [Jiangellaceae bacterium]